MNAVRDKIDFKLRTEVKIVQMNAKFEISFEELVETSKFWKQIKSEKLLFC